MLTNCLTSQVWYMTGPAYLGFLAKPNQHTQMPSLLGHPILDQCSMTPWYVPGLYLLWVVATYGSFLGFMVGILGWTLLEYAVHRYIFHFDIRPFSHLSYVRVLHFFLHGLHHLYPNDPLRLVLPPIFTLPPAYFFSLLLPPSVFSGLIFGYVCYDIGHYWMHHVKDCQVWPFSTRQWKTLRTHHMAHHYSNPNKGFGVSSPLWDYVAERMKMK